MSIPPAECIDFVNVFGKFYSATPSLTQMAGRDQCRSLSTDVIKIETEEEWKAFRLLRSN